MKSKQTAHIIRHFARADKKLLPRFADMELELLKADSDASRYFARLCHEIIFQQLAGSAARAIYARFEALFPNKKPNPKRLLAYSEKELRKIGVSWAKARYLRDLAEKVQNRSINLKSLGALDNEAAIAELSKVKGIGRWTAEMFLIFALGREDIFSFGDLGLQRELIKLYGAHRTKTDAHVARITNRWSPYRSYGCLALWHASDTAKKT